MRALQRDQRIARSKRNLWIAMSGAAVVLVMGGLLMWAAVGVNPRLGSDLCPSPDRIVGSTIMLVDVTDPWSELRKAAVQREIAEITSSVPRFEQVSLYVVSPSALALNERQAAVTTLCNPGTPEQVEADARERGLPAWLISNPVRARARFDTAFAGVISSLVGEAAEALPQAQSPIIETLRHAVLHAGGRHPPSIMMISDLYQNTDLCSFYGEPQCLGNAAPLSDPILGGIHGLSESQVEIRLLSPAGGEWVPRDTLVQFWYNYFRRQGALITRVKRIEQ